MIEEKSSTLDDLEGGFILTESNTLDSSLLEEAPAKKKGKKAAKPPKPVARQTPDVEMLISRHRDSYLYSCGEPYSTSALAKDCKAAKALLKTYGLEKCLELNDAFFSSQDPFVKNSGFDFQTFRGVINRLVIAPRAVKAEKTMDLGELS
jgi:hypothetical protein